MLLLTASAVAAWWWARPEVVEGPAGAGNFKIVRQVYRDDEGNAVNHGRWTLLDEQGRRRCEGFSQNGIPMGLWTYRNAAGGKLLAGEYRGGERHGPWIAWHANGRKRDATEYVDGRRHGPTRTYGPQGRWLRDGVYEQGRRSGHWTFWRKNGRKRAEGDYQKGQREGLWLAWDEQGRALPQETFIAGRRLSDVKRAVALWRTHLHGDDYDLRDEAAWALGKLGEPAAPILAAAARSPKRDLRRRAAIALGQIGPAAECAVPSLISLLDQDPTDASTIFEATIALASIGPEAKSALERLRTLRTHNDRRLRAAAMGTRISIDPTQPEVISELASEVATMESASDLKLTIDGLRVGPKRPRFTDGIGWWTQEHSFPRLPDAAQEQALASLGNTDPVTRASAALTLGLIEQSNAEAQAALIAALDDSDANVRRCAAIALGMLAHSDAEKRLQAAAKKDKDVVVRKAANWALNEIQQRMGSMLGSGIGLNGLSF